ncbi:MAG TPA: phage major capsid protein [Steroidobacteraceae bacterium]|nr:phage major capsid protein [Steroidobacteraceae bacterium]
MNYAEHIANLEATKKAKQDRMKELHQKSVDEGRTMDTAEAEEFETLETEIKAIDADLARTRKLKAIEDADKSTAKPVDDSDKRNAKAQPSGVRIDATAKDTTKLDKGMGFARIARVKALAHLNHADPLQVAQNVYPGDERLVKSIQVEKAAVAAAATTSATWAGNLVLDAGAYFADFVEYLRERSVLGQISDRLRRLPFDTQVLVQGTAGSASWVKEGAAKPLTSWTYTRTKLAPLKVAAIAAATKEQLSRASVAADTLIRDELARAVNAAIDGTFVSDAAAVSDESPAGIRNGVSPLTLTGDGTIAGIRCDIATFLKELVGDNLTVSGAFWIMSEATAIDLSMAVNEVGAPAFPGVTPTGGTLAGLPVFTSQYVADESEGPVVMLIKGDEIFLGDEGGIQVSISDQASLVMDNAPSMNSVTPTGVNTGSQALVSLWQTNSVGFLVERFINFAKRRAQAVVWAHVNWSACNGQS